MWCLVYWEWIACIDTVGIATQAIHKCKDDLS
jgi:hypothetical protein